MFRDDQFEPKVVVGKPEDVLAVKKAFGVNLVKLTDELRKVYKTEAKE